MSISQQLLSSNNIDIAIMVFMSFSIITAFFRGIIKEVFTLLALYLSAVASYFSGHLLFSSFGIFLGANKEGGFKQSDFIFGILPPPLAAKIFSYLAVYVVVFIIITVIGYIFNKSAKKAGLGFVSRVGGAGFGALRGFLLIFAVYLPLVILVGQEKFPEWVKSSALLPVFDKVFVWTDQKFDLSKKIQEQNNIIKAKFEEKISEDFQRLVGEAQNEYAQRVADGQDPEEVSRDLVTNVIKELGRSSAGLEEFPVSDEILRGIIEKAISVSQNADG